MDLLGRLINFTINFLKCIPGGRQVLWLFSIGLGFLSRLPLLGIVINRVATNSLATQTQARPRPFSLWSHVRVPKGKLGPVSDFTSWPGLTDKKFSARHLSPLSPPNPKNIAQLTELFMRPTGSPQRPDRSSLLFMFFAQWFTDSFMRVNGDDRRQNTSNHDIDLCQIYGLDEKTCRLLRSLKDGRLKCRPIKGAEYPDLLCEPRTTGGFQVKREYKRLPHNRKTFALMKQSGVPIARASHLYATGLDNGNGSIGYTAISTLFLREHNRIAGELVARYRTDPEWRYATDPVYFDERVFQTARMINTVVLLKLVVEEYINHISGIRLFKLDHKFAEQQSWYRHNWVSLEFNLLYRWHGMVPDILTVNNTSYPHLEYRFNNKLLENLGMENLVTAVSATKAGRIGLLNTSIDLQHAEQASVAMAQAFQLQTYNAYRKQFGLWRFSSLSQLTKNQAQLAAIEAIYSDVNDVDLLTGLFAEDRYNGAIFGDLMNAMVSYDAFTQIYTNPLLSKHVYGEKTFTEVGMKIIASTNSLKEFAHRNRAPKTTVNAAF